MNRIRNRHLLLAGLLVLILSCPVSAQSKIKKSEQASIQFDLDVDALRKNEIVKMIGLKNMLDQADVMPPGDEFDVETVMRVHGAFQLPDSLDAFTEMGPDDDLPMNFFVRLEFSDAKGIKSILKEIEGESRKTEKDGKTYYQPPEGFGPDNLYVHLVNEKTIEFGTTSYVFHANRDVTSPALDKLWKKLPKQAIRIAADIEASRGLFDDLIAMTEQNEPEAAEFLSLIDDIARLAVVMDPNNKKMFEIRSESLGSDSAKNLKSGLDGLLLMARAGAKEVLRDSPVEDKDFLKVAEEIVDQLKARQDDQAVTITINKPENFEAATRVLMKEAKKSAEKVNKMNEFRQIAIGVHTYYDSYRRMPFNPREASGMSKDLSWRCRVLPFVDGNNLYEQMNMKEGWDSDTNKKWAEKMPAMFGKNGKTTTMCWVKSDVTTFASIIDGTSRTVMMLENPAGVAWSKPNDLTAEDAVKLVSGLKDGQTLVAVFYDASVHQLDNTIDKETLMALMTPDGKEVIDFDEDGKPKIEK